MVILGVREVFSLVLGVCRRRKGALLSSTCLHGALLGGELFELANQDRVNSPRRPLKHRCWAPRSRRRQDLSASVDRPGTWPYNVFAHLGLSSVVVVMMLAVCDITDPGSMQSRHKCRSRGSCHGENPASW